MDKGEISTGNADGFSLADGEMMEMLIFRVNLMILFMTLLCLPRKSEQIVEGNDMRKSRRTSV